MNHDINNSQSIILHNNECSSQSNETLQLNLEEKSLTHEKKYSISIEFKHQSNKDSCNIINLNITHLYPSESLTQQSNSTLDSSLHKDKSEYTTLNSSAQQPNSTLDPSLHEDKSENTTPNSILNPSLHEDKSEYTILNSLAQQPNSTLDPSLHEDTTPNSILNPSLYEDKSEYTILNSLAQQSNSTLDPSLHEDKSENTTPNSILNPSLHEDKSEYTILNSLAQQLNSTLDPSLHEDTTPNSILNPSLYEDKSEYTILNSLAQQSNSTLDPSLHGDKSKNMTGYCMRIPHNRYEYNDSACNYSYKDGVYWIQYMNVPRDRNLSHRENTTQYGDMIPNQTQIQKWETEREEFDAQLAMAMTLSIKDMIPNQTQIQKWETEREEFDAQLAMAMTLSIKDMIPNQTQIQKWETEREEFDAQLAMAMTLSIKDMMRNPSYVNKNFFELLNEKKFNEAIEIYSSADKDAKELIDTELNKIPWRISCEYYRKLDKLYWINTWIKICWWPKDECEISPQLSKGHWYHNNNNKNIPAPAISHLAFDCVVWKGYGKEMIIKLLSFGDKINIEYELDQDFLTPIDVAFSTPKDPTHILDLSSIELGSLSEISEQNLDILRLYHSTKTLPNNTQLVRFRGSTLGEFFVENYDRLHDSNNVDDIDDNFDQLQNNDEIEEDNDEL